MAAANNEFFEALSMLEHERGITAEYLIEKIKAAIIIAVKKNYEVEEDHVKVDIDPAAGRFDVALIQDVVACPRSSFPEWSGSGHAGSLPRHRQSSHALPQHPQRRCLCRRSHPQ